MGKESFSSTLPFEEDIREVLKYSFQQFDVELDCQLADLISCFAFGGLQFEKEQFNTQRLIEAIKVETGRCLTKIEARNALKRMNWDLEKTFSKILSEATCKPIE